MRVPPSPSHPTTAARAAIAPARAALLGLVALLAACGGADPEPPADAVLAETGDAATAPPVIEVAAGDFFYEMADTIAAGAVTLQLTTTGQEMHHLQLVRLAEGKTAEEFFAAMQGEAPPPWAELVGGPNVPIPNATTSSVTLNLAPGTYVAMCMIPSPDGSLHVAKGMSKTVVVAPSENGAALPVATAKMTLVDYDFVMDAPLRAGPQILEVTTAMGQPHEVVIVKLAPGATAAQFVAWVQTMEGPPPATPIGGTVGLNQGLTNYVHLDLEPGEYGLFCFLPDAKDAKPHVAHGMIKQITVM